MGLLSAIFGGGGSDNENTNQNTVTSNNEINNFTTNEIGVGIENNNIIDLSAIAQALELSSSNSSAALLQSTALNLQGQNNLTDAIGDGLKSLGTNALIVGTSILFSVMLTRAIR